jgi:hypothetical protein
MEQITPTSSSESSDPSTTATAKSSISSASSSSTETPTRPQNLVTTPTSTTFGSKTRDWISSWSETSHQTTMASSAASRSYYNLDKNSSNRMPDLLIDQSPLESKRVWIGGKTIS